MTETKHISCYEFEAKNIFREAKLFYLDVEKIVLEYCNWVQTFALQQITALPIDRARKMWKSRNNRFLIEGEYDHEQSKDAESCPSSTIVYEIVPHSAPVLVKDCGNQGESWVEQMSTGKTILVSDGKLFDLDDEAKIEIKDVQTIGSTYVVNPPIWAEKDEISLHVRHQSVYYLNTTRWPPLVPKDHRYTLKTHALCKNMLELPFLGVVSTSCTLDGSLVAVLCGHPKSDEFSDEAMGSYYFPNTQCIPCGLAIWQNQTLRSPILKVFSSLKEFTMFRAFMDFVTSSHLLVSGATKVKNGWMFKFRLVHIFNNQCSVIWKDSCTLILDTESWRLDCLYARKECDENHVWILFFDKTGTKKDANSFLLVHLILKKENEEKTQTLTLMDTS